jgi:hypothetical protein
VSASPVKSACCLRRLPLMCTTTVCHTQWPSGRLGPGSRPLGLSPPRPRPLADFQRGLPKVDFHRDTDQAFDVGLHDQLEEGFSDRPQKIALILLCRSAVRSMLVLVIGAPCGPGLNLRNFTLTITSVATPITTALPMKSPRSWTLPDEVDKAGDDLYRLRIYNRRIRRAGDEFLNRLLTSEWPYVWLDATYLKQRQGERIISVAAIIAVAVNTEGRRSGAQIPASFRSSICASFASG